MKTETTVTDLRNTLYRIKIAQASIEHAARSAADLADEAIVDHLSRAAVWVAAARRRIEDELERQAHGVRIDWQGVYVAEQATANMLARREEAQP